jgi:hypothetical protein
MRIDWYTKAVLTAIAVLLGVIALRPYVGPEVVQAQGAFSGVQGVLLNIPQNEFSFFDARSGDFWYYHSNQVTHKWHLTGLGQPIVKER